MIPSLWVPSPNYGYPTGKAGRGGHQVVAIVNHIAQGTRAGLISEFKSPATQKSSTYGVDVDGTIIYFVDEANAAYANGVDFPRGYDAYRSNLAVPWIKDCWDRRVNPNLVTVSIEHVGYSGQPLTEKQYQASLALHRALFTKYGWDPADRTRIVGHVDIDSVNKPNCPGPSFPWGRLRADLAREQEAGEVDPDFLQYGTTWREVAVNLLGVATDALEAGRKQRDLASQVIDTWGHR